MSRGNFLRENHDLTKLHANWVFELTTVDKEFETDVLVIGSEGAGARAALEAEALGAKVTVVTKSIMAKSGVTLVAVFSCDAAFGYVDPRDNWEAHLKDTVVGGRYLNNQKLTEIMTKQAPARMDELAKWGVNWDKEGEKYKLTKMYGHTYPRSLSVDFKTGLAIMQALKHEVSHRKGITLLEEVFISNYMSSPEGDIIGAMGVDLKTGEFVVIRAKATIDATGGAMNIYQFNSGTPESTGDGFAMSYRNGAELVDMEFVQYFPLGLRSPPALRGSEHISSFARSWIRGRLYNASGERFMERYDPKRMELADRDVLSIAVFKEIIEGRGTANGGVWLDATFLADKIIETRIQQVAPNWKVGSFDLLDYGLDLRKVPLEVGPTTHFFCGGIRVNEQWATTLSGLFAAGEAAGGVHGANRIPGNALPDTQVSGAIAGKSAVEYGKTRKTPKVNEEQVKTERERVYEIFERKDGIRPFVVREKLQKLMQMRVGVLRDEQGLQTALEEISLMKKDLPSLCLANKTKIFNREWIESLELRNMLDVAEMVARSALFRTESRGNHQRADYVESSNTWLKNIVIKKTKNNEIALTPVPTIMTKIKPQEI